MDILRENPAVYFEREAMLAGIKIDDLCRKAKIARSTLTRWKSEETDPFKKFRKLQKALDDLKAKAPTN